MPEFERISITIEPALLARLDALVEASGHANRSELIRDLVRARLVEERGDDEEVAGTLTLVYHHGQRALADKLVDVAHDNEAIVLATLHVHLDRDHCLEVSALRGRGARAGWPARSPRCRARHRRACRPARAARGGRPG